MTPDIDLDSLCTLLRDAARAEIMPRFRQLGEGDIRSKSEPSDLVTAADEAAEHTIRSGCASLLPGALFVGEEASASQPELLDSLAGAELAIVVDPVDGTFNFAAGMPLFGVMAAVVFRGETIAGIIYDPLGDDFVVAERGSGAFLRRTNATARRLRCATAVTLEEMVGMASIGYLPKVARATVASNLIKVRLASSYRCAAHEYRMFTSGFAHFLMYNKLMPWDHLAGSLIAEESGACVARFDGSRYLPGQLDGGLLVAPDKASWELLRREVFTV